MCMLSDQEKHDACTYEHLSVAPTWRPIDKLFDPMTKFS